MKCKGVGFKGSHRARFGMKLELMEQRRSSRVEFFLVPVDGEQVPVWHFVPPHHAHQTAGLILNLSLGGLQVLTAADALLEAPNYRVELALGEPDGLPAFGGEVRRVWCRPLSQRGDLHGFMFTDPASPAAAFLNQYQPSLQRRDWVRCTLTDGR